MDIIVLPESCDIPALAKTKELAEESVRKFNKIFLDKAHKNGIICNVFWSDDPQKAKQLVEMGIDTILTNEYGIVSQAVKD